MRAAPFLALVCFAAILTAGCAGPCTSFPTWATLDFHWTEGEAALLSDLEGTGWVLESRAAGQRPRASFETPAGPVWVSVAVQNESARLLFEGPTRGTTTLAAAREELAPAVGTLTSRYDAVATYHAGTQQCGDV